MSEETGRTQAGVGVSHHRNPAVAGAEAAAAALERAGLGGRPDFVMVFASVGYAQERLLEAIAERTGGAPMAGCSGEGIIARGVADEGNFSVAVLVVRSDELRFHPALALGMAADPEACGAQIGAALAPHADERVLGMIVLADGLAFNYDRFVRGLEAAFPPRELMLFGGMAADNWSMTQTWLYLDGQVHTDGACCVLMTGSVDVAYAVNHGCVPIGTERLVTRSEGNVIYEIDGKPVLDILKEYVTDDEIDQWTSTVVNLSWGLEAAPDMRDDYDSYLIRFMPKKDDDAGSITLSTEVPAGTRMWMTRRDHEKIAHGIGRIGRAIRGQIGERAPKIVFQFDCAGRGKLVFREQQKLDLLESLQGPFGSGPAWIGLYVYGEIGPVRGRNSFHNYTLSLLALY